MAKVTAGQSAINALDMLRFSTLAFFGMSFLLAHHLEEGRGKKKAG